MISVLMLFLVVVHLMKKEPDVLLEGVEPVDQKRENIVSYEEEGAGRPFLFHFNLCVTVTSAGIVYLISVIFLKPFTHEIT